MRIRGAAATDVGSTRAVNQDAIFWNQIGRNGAEFALCAVCDGVGGLEHGEIASSFLVAQMEEWFQETAEWIDIQNVDTAILFSHLKDAAEVWNEGVLQICEQNNIRTGSTMSLLLMIRDCYYIIHVGDSRIYRCRNGNLAQLTVDASVTRLKNGYAKNYLSNYMGKGKELWFQALEGEIEDGDIFVLGSDGFYHHLTDNEIPLIRQIQKKKSKMQEICQQLIELMISRGEKDNISVCLIAAEKQKTFKWRR